LKLEVSSLNQVTASSKLEYDFSLIIAALHFTLMPTTRGARCKATEAAILQSGATQTVIPTEAQTRIPPVDEIVHDQALYVKLCEEQSVVFRQNVEEFTKEYALYLQSSDVVKPGQNWKPVACDRDAFVAEMKRRCQKVPNSIAE
jgi:hypothetical protein